MVSAEAGAGLILIFDLDQTIIDSDNLYRLLAIEEAKQNSRAWEILDSKLNKDLLDTILMPAVTLREEGHIDAICLLTNNADRQYVANICILLNHLLTSEGRFGFIRNSNQGNHNFPNVPTFFDYVMVRQHPSREQSPNPPKSLNDVKYMVESLGIKYTDAADLARRTFFFDDNTTHVLARELTMYGYPDHFIPIRGPDSENGINKGFVAGKPDLTNYISIKTVFSRIQRGLVAVPLKSAYSSPSPAVKRYKISIIGSETGVSDADATYYLEKAGWDTSIAINQILQNKSKGGRRKKTIANRLRYIYGRKITRKHK